MPTAALRPLAIILVSVFRTKRGHWFADAIWKSPGFPEALSGHITLAHALEEPHDSLTEALDTIVAVANEFHLPFGRDGFPAGLIYDDDTGGAEPPDAYLDLLAAEAQRRGWSFERDTYDSSDHDRQASL